MPEIPSQRSHDPPLGGKQPPFASSTPQQTEDIYDNIQNDQPHTEAAPFDTFTKIAPNNADVNLSALPDLLNTTDNSLIMPATNMSELLTIL